LCDFRWVVSESCPSEADKRLSTSFWLNGWLVHRTDKDHKPRRRTTKNSSAAFLPSRGLTFCAPWLGRHDDGKLQNHKRRPNVPVEATTWCETRHMFKLERISKASSKMSIHRRSFLCKLKKYFDPALSPSRGGANNETTD